MVTKKVMFVLASCLIISFVSCAGSKTPMVESSNDAEMGKVLVAKRYLETAKEFEKRGLHFEASVYFEAALDGGLCEVEVLPLLVVSLVRAGRLEAARHCIERLVQIAPDRECVVELKWLVTNLTLGTSKHMDGEAR